MSVFILALHAYKRSDQLINTSRRPFWPPFTLIRRNSPNHPEGVPSFVLPHPLPQAPKKVKLKLPTTPLPSPVKATKRPAPDDDDVMEHQPAKRLKTNANRNVSDPSSPRKQRQLEEDGLIILDGPEESQDDAEIIIVD